MTRSVYPRSERGASTDVSEIVDYPDGHELGECDEGDHEIRRLVDHDRRLGCQICRLSLQTISDVLGHEVRLRLPVAVPDRSSRTIVAWARCNECDSGGGGRAPSHPRQVRVSRFDVYSRIRRGCRDCQEVTTWSVAGPARPGSKRRSKHGRVE